MIHKRKEYYRTEEEKLRIVKENGCRIRTFWNPSEQLQLAALKNEGFAIEFIHNPTDTVLDWLYEYEKEIYLEFYEKPNND